MKKLIFIAGLLLTPTVYAGPLADVAKAKFESDMLQALENTGGGQEKINEFMAKLPGIEKQLRGVVRDELKNEKSCLKIKRDFVKQQKEIMSEEDWPDQYFVNSMLSATGDYVATVCLDMK